MGDNASETILRDAPEQQRLLLYQLLGRLPDRQYPIKAALVSRQETDELLIEKLLFDLNGQEPVPAYFTKPKQQAGPLPVILYNHAHFGQYETGKEEFVAGRTHMQQPPYALALVRAGYAGLCLDNWCFGERRQRSEADTFKAMLWHGQVLWGMMVYDNLRALDYLQTRTDIDPNRIGTMGMSMGSTMAWWLAALDERIKVCVDLCCLTDYQALLETNGLDLHSIYYYVPDLLTHFTTAQINALIAPRPHLSLAGRYDPLTPPAGLERIDQHLRGTYRQHDAPDAWQLKIYEVEHQETATMREDVLAFFSQWL